jgi:GNAT superfamily N-acetyltransferase
LEKQRLDPRDIQVDLLDPDVSDPGDIEAIGQIAHASFHGYPSPAHAAEWVGSLLRAFPVYQVFVARAYGQVAGYVSWQCHGGFGRPELVVELEQLAIADSYSRMGIGSALIERARAELAGYLWGTHGRRPIVWVVWTYEHNGPAVAVYSRTFGDGIVGRREMFDRPEVMLRGRTEPPR